MTDYNDGRWHGWNGGECPVHPKTKVEAVCTSIVPSGYGRASWKTAGEIDWAGGIPSEVVAFRVVKEHREPREWWIVPGVTEMPYSIPLYDTKPCVGAVRVREILDDEKSEGL